ncbi:hypothetical protein B0H13DRAFT_2360043 [Mycena leptocephala]|nr:hypothetical protein B0H13DRAFT_2360043 [Mycena leptocephala]
MEHARALVLTEKRCYIVAINCIYQNPPLETTTLDCKAAKRRLPCSLCAERNDITVDFPSSPLPPGIVLPQFTPPVSPNSAPITAAQKKLKLKKKEREEAEAKLTSFAETVHLAECNHVANQYRPKSSYLPTSIRNTILTNLLSLSSLATLTALLESWVFAVNHLNPLYNVVKKLRNKFNSERERAQLKKNEKQWASRRAKKRLEDSEAEEFSEEEELHLIGSVFRGIPGQHTAGLLRYLWASYIWQ